MQKHHQAAGKVIVFDLFSISIILLILRFYNVITISSLGLKLLIEPPLEKKKQQKTNNICICENKGSDQLRSNTDSTFPLLLFLNPKFSASDHQVSVLVQLDFCRTCSETTLLVFSWCDSIITIATSFYTLNIQRQPV